MYTTRSHNIDLTTFTLVLTYHSNPLGLRKNHHNMPSYAIAGASRGIGVRPNKGDLLALALLTLVQYALLKELSADPANVVIGIVRSTGPLEEKIANELPGRKNIHVVYGDLVNLSSLKVLQSLAFPKCSTVVANLYQSRQQIPCLPSPGAVLTS